MIVKFSIFASIVVSALSGVVAAESPRTIPTVYEAGHFYAVPETVDGQTLRLLVDTAGGGSQGMYWITAEAANRLQLDTRACQSGRFTLTVAALPDYKKDRGLPAPVDSSCGKAVKVQDVPFDEDGQLGAAYFPGRVWTFDYPGKRLLVQPPSWQPEPSAHAFALGPAFYFPQITIHVAGQPIEMLLDTGATAHPTAVGKKASGTPTVTGIGVTSYIDRSTFERWHKMHPDWRVVEKGDDLFGPDRTARIIEVPEVRIAGWSVGPVWFTERPDSSFNFFDKFTDTPMSGAAGANIFKHFVMTIDYPDATVYFRCVSDCTPVN